MKKTIYFLFIFSFVFNSLLAQKKILLYSSGNTYLSLKAESFLEELANRSSIQEIDSKNKIGNIENLNRLIRIKGIQTEIKSTIHTFNPYGFLKLKKEDENYLKEISDVINDCDLFLNIGINKFEDIVEYQLELFEYNKINVESKGEIKFFKLINHNLIGKANFFIDPKEDDYLVQLNNGIRSLFRNTNFIPKPVIYINNKPFLENKVIYWGLADSLLIDASQSEDLDNDDNNLTFEWALLDYNGKKPNELQKINFQKNSSVQNILFPFSGKYKIGIKIWDGIAYSQEDSITIDVVDNPVQYLRHKSYHFLKQGKYFEVLSYKKRVKAFKLENRKLNNYISTSTGHSGLFYSELQNNKSIEEFLEKRVESVLIKGKKKNNGAILKSNFHLTAIDTLGKGVFKHAYNLNFSNPGSYWLTAFDEQSGVKSKIDTININYYYKLPFELDVFFDRIKLPVDTTQGSVPEGWSSICIGAKINLIKAFSFDFQIPLLLNKSSLNINKISAFRFGVSARFSNTIYKLIPSEALRLNDHPSFDGYLGIYKSEIIINSVAKCYEDWLFTSGIKFAPHKKLWTKNLLLEYNIGYTINLSNLEKAKWISDMYGFQFGVTLGMLKYEN